MQVECYLFYFFLPAKMPPGGLFPYHLTSGATGVFEMQTQQKVWVTDNKVSYPF